MKKNKPRKILRNYKILRGCFVTAIVTLLAFPVVEDFGLAQDRIQIVVDGVPVGVADTLEEAEYATSNARYILNSQREQLTLVDAQVEYVPVNQLTAVATDSNELVQNIYDELVNHVVNDKAFAYTVKVNDFTVTLASEADVVAMLEQVQGQYDPNNEFHIELASGVKTEMGELTTNVTNSSVTANNQVLVTSDGEGDAVVTDASVDVGQDGILSVEFVEDIEIVESYVTPEEIVDVDTAVAAITKEQQNNEIYQVQTGDCLSLIAGKYGMSTDELLAINEGLEADSNILVGDQLVVMVPKPEISVLMQEQKTYTENYDAPVEYVDNPNRYVGDNTVIQEPVAGERTVTAVITYNNGAETGREIIKEIQITPAVAKIVERGTMPLPTYIRPTTYGVLTSPFGPRWGTVHKGIDWGVPVGTACRASRSGRVVSAGWSGGYGYCVVIDHGDGVRTRYAHLSVVQCSVGQYVNQGDVIALTGNTGNSTGPHIHFEIIVNGVHVNPANYL